MCLTHLSLMSYEGGHGARCQHMGPGDWHLVKYDARQPSSHMDRQGEEVAQDWTEQGELGGRHCFLHKFDVSV